MPATTLAFPSISSATVPVNQAGTVLPQDSIVPSTTTNGLDITQSDKAKDLASKWTLDVNKPETVMSLGATAQQASAAISSQLLAHVNVKDAGDVGNLLGQLAVRCKGIDVKKLEPGFSAKLANFPVIGSFFSKAISVGEGYMNTANELDTISSKLSTARDTILQDVNSLGMLYTQNEAIYNDLKLWIEVGHIKIQDLDNQIANGTAYGSTKQQIDDLTALRERLDKHTHDLELTAMIRLQNAPKIRIIQDGNVVLAEKLQSSVLNTVPLWKDNLALAITQMRQKTAVELQNRVDDATNAMLKQSADMLHENSVLIAKAAGRGVVDLETLQHTQTQLLATITDVQAITKDVDAKREATRIELANMVKTLQAA